MPDPNSKKSSEQSPRGGSPESNLFAAVEALVMRERTVKQQFGPFEVGDVVRVDKYDLIVTVRSCKDPSKTYQVDPKEYINLTE